MNRFMMVFVLAGCSSDPFVASGAALEGDSGLGGSSGSAGSTVTSEAGAGARSAAGSGGSDEGGSGGEGGTATSDSGLALGGSSSDDAGVLSEDAGGSGGATVEAGPVAECETSAVRCEGSQPQTCVAGAWYASGVSCSVACLNGACVECVPGSDTGCLSPTQPGACDATGHRVPSGPACAGATPQCSGNSCVACNPDTVSSGGYCPSCSGAALCWR